MSETAHSHPQIDPRTPPTGEIVGAEVTFPGHMATTVRDVFAQLAVNYDSGFVGSAITSVVIIDNNSHVSTIPVRTREMLIRLAAEAIEQAAAMPA